ncbi:uncharacterized protein BKA78DRAFT_184209 [Phyllosticta capitalensis]|uniref:uncharacterized protein n=1 Tax=Phyllosticta capitalensis TaxID=121624 RepID=UPI00312F4A20
MLADAHSAAPGARILTFSYFLWRTLGVDDASSSSSSIVWWILVRASWVGCWRVTTVRPCPRLLGALPWSAWFSELCGRVARGARAERPDGCDRVFVCPDTCTSPLLASRVDGCNRPRSGPDEAQSSRRLPTNAPSAVLGHSGYRKTLLLIQESLSPSQNTSRGGVLKCLML